MYCEISAYPGISEPFRYAKGILGIKFGQNHHSRFNFINRTHFYQDLVLEPFCEILGPFTALSDSCNAMIHFLRLQTINICSYFNVLY